MTDSNSSHHDFVYLKTTFDEKLTPGQRAEIRRIRNPDDLSFVPATYRLLPRAERPHRGWLRLIYFCPVLDHSTEAKPLGTQLASKEVSEVRLFQIIRSELPQDLQYLRRVCEQVHPVVDWQQFGPLLFYWNRSNKKRLIEDYYLAESIAIAPNKE